MYVRWEELDLDPTSPPGSCVLQRGPSRDFCRVGLFFSVCFEWFISKH